jgi:hypothetical protein
LNDTEEGCVMAVGSTSAPEGAVFMLPPAPDALATPLIHDSGSAYLEN